MKQAQSILIFYSVLLSNLSTCFHSPCQHLNRQQISEGRLEAGSHSEKIYLASDLTALWTQNFAVRYDKLREGIYRWIRFDSRPDSSGSALWSSTENKKI